MSDLSEHRKYLPRSRSRAIVPASFFQHNSVLSAHKFGRNADVDAAEDLVSQGGNQYWPTTAATTTLDGSSAEDKPGGSGIHSVRCYGLDADGHYMEQDVITDGTDAVAMDPMLRCWRTQALTGASSLAVAAGTLDVLHGANVLCRIPLGFSASQAGIFSTPRGYVAEVSNWHMRAEGKPTVQINWGLQVRDPSATANSWVTWDYGETTDGQSSDHEYKVPILVPELFDVKMRVLSVTAASQVCHGSFDILVFPAY